MKTIGSFPILMLVLAACATGTPQPAASSTPTEKTIGGPCASDSDCPGTYACDRDDPGGECTRKCASNADCGPSGTCTPEKDCLASCQTNADCKRPGYACMGQAPQAYCDIPESTEKH